MLKINFSRDAQKFLEKLPAKQKHQIALKIMEIRELKGSHDSKHLKGYPFLRADVGEYRIVYEIDGDALLLILLIGKRNDHNVYRKLSRKLK